jgi:lycopene cyclase domain-containing protein
VFAIIIALDKWLLRTHLLHLANTRLLKTSVIFLLFQLLFDNYFTWKGLWVFDPHAVMGIFLPFIPIENLFFGLELLWMSMLLYQFFLAPSSR